LKKYKTLVLTIISVLFLTGCLKNEENCETIGFLGEFELVQQSKEFIPYDDPLNSIIFSNIEGDEFEGKIEYNRLNTVLSLSGTEQCPFDEDVEISYTSRKQTHSVEIIINELNIRLTLDVFTITEADHNADNPVADQFNLCMQDIDSGITETCLMKTIEERNSDPYIIHNPVKHDKFEIHGKEFCEVYSDEENQFTDYNLFYNMDLGIVAIRSKTDPSFSYKFERTE